MEEFKPFMKYGVYKLDDAQKYLTEEENSVLNGLLAKIKNGRLVDKKLIHSYVVVNNNMPFAPMVWQHIENWWKLEQGIKEEESRPYDGRDRYS